MLVGNKGDCQLERTVSKTAAQNWADENGCIAYIETSAKEYSNVNEAFEEVAKHTLKRIKFDDNMYVNLLIFFLKVLLTLFNSVKEKRNKARSKVKVSERNEKVDDDSICC